MGSFLRKEFFNFMPSRWTKASKSYLITHMLCAAKPPVLQKVTNVQPAPITFLVRGSSASYTRSQLKAKATTFTTPGQVPSLQRDSALRCVGKPVCLQSPNILCFGFAVKGRTSKSCFGTSLEKLHRFGINKIVTLIVLAKWVMEN